MAEGREVRRVARLPGGEQGGLKGQGQGQVSKGPSRSGMGREKMSPYKRRENRRHSILEAKRTGGPEKEVKISRARSWWWEPKEGKPRGASDLPRRIMRDLGQSQCQSLDGVEIRLVVPGH